MSERAIAELRQAAAEAWKRGSMADSSRTLSALNAAVEEYWRAGNCCGQCTAGGVCQSIHLQVFRYLHWGYYYAGVAVKDMGSFCDRSPEGLAEIRKIITSELMERLFIRRLLELVFGWDENRHGILFRKAWNMANEVINVETAERQLSELRESAKSIASDVMRGLQQAKMIRLARGIISHHVSELAELQGSSVGFQCDRQYQPTELIDPLTEAMVRGLPITGNCINIISGRLYIPLEGWQHLFRSHGELTYPRVTIGEVDIVKESEWVEIPKEAQKMRNGRMQTSRAVPGIAKVAAIGECELDGMTIRVEFLDKSETPGQIDGRIAIRVNHGMGEDAIQGKARRRVLKALYLQAMGQADGAEDDDGVIEGSYAATTEPASAAPVAAIEAAQPAPPSSSNAERITKMLDAFSALGVTVPMIRDRLKVDDLATIGEQELSLLGTVYKAMKDKGRTWAATE